MSNTALTDEAMRDVIAGGGELGMHDLPLIECSRRLEMIAARLLVLATKHVPRTHHDWEVVVELAVALDTSPGED